MEQRQIEEFCSMAKDICKRIEESDLDFSMDSLVVVENTIQYVRNLHRKELVDDSVCWNMSVALGTYSGEVYLLDQLSELGFSWKENEDGIPVIVSANGKNAISPITKIYKKLTEIESDEDEEGDVTLYYNTFLLLLNLPDDWNNNLRE